MTAPRHLDGRHRSPEEVLHTTSGETLLRTYASLTHRIHDHQEKPLSNVLHQQREGNDLRAQRDVLEAEILRRMREN